MLIDALIKYLCLLWKLLNKKNNEKPKTIKIKRLKKPMTNQEVFDWKSQKMIERFKNYEFKMPKEWVLYIFNRRQKHTFHIVSNSPWPICTSMSVTCFIFGILFVMHDVENGFFLLTLGFGLVLASMFFWFRDIIREATYMGYHTRAVQQNLRTGFILFLVSEIMFFFSFFWAYFHCSLSPSIWGGAIWPPEGIVYFFISENLSTIFSFHRLVYLDNIYTNNFYWLHFKGIFRPFILNREVFGPYIWEEQFVNINTNNYEIDYCGISSCSEKIRLFNSVQLFKDNIGTEVTTFEFLFKRSRLLRSKEILFYLNLFNKGVLLNPYKYPLLNTVILLTSGSILTVSHNYLRIERFFRSIIALGITILFAFCFIACQFYEYVHAAFSINDGIYGSLFFMLTGFHGFHVIVGTVFLTVCWFRFVNMHFTRTDHFGLEAAIWYWHFVDVIRIFLFFVVYLWPSVYFFENCNDLYIYKTYYNMNLNTKALQNIQILDFYSNLMNDNYLGICFKDPIYIMNKFFHFSFSACARYLDYFYFSTKFVCSFISFKYEAKLLSLDIY